MLSRPYPLLPFDHRAAEQLHWDTATEEITFATPVAQTFRCAHDALYRIEIFIEPTFHYKRCHLWLQLFAEENVNLNSTATPPASLASRPASRSPTSFRSVSLPIPLRLAGPIASEQITAHGWISFEFEPIAGSAGQTYTLRLVSPDGTPGNALSVRAARRTGRGLSVAGQPREGSLLFRAVCQRSPAIMPNFQRYLRASRQHTATIDYTPLMVQIEVSRPCNLHCVMCHRGLTPYNAKREGAAFMSLATFQGLDPILPDLLWMIAFGLGEPFLNPQYLAILRHAKARNPFLHMFTSTNGTCLTDPTLDAIVAEGLMETFQISLDGSERETFEAIRKNASYDVVFRCFQRVVAARERERSAMRIRASMLVMKPTTEQVFPFIRQMADMGVDLISLGTPKDSAFKYLRADSTDEMSRIYDQVVRGHESLAGTGTMLDGPILSELFEWHRRSGRTDALPRWGYDETATLVPATPSQRAPCGVPWETFNLAADGAVRLCCNSYRTMGQLPREMMSVLWQQGQPYTGIRSELLTRAFHDNCRECLSGGLVTSDLVTPPLYREAVFNNPSANTQITRLLGQSVASLSVAEATNHSVELEESSPEPHGSAPSRWRIHGWLHTDASSLPAHPAKSPTLLALALDGIVRDVIAAVTVSPGLAQFSTSLTSAPASATTHRIEVFQLRFVTDALVLERLPRSPSQSPATSSPTAASTTTRTSPTAGSAAIAPPWLRPDSPLSLITTDSPLHGFVDEVKIEAGVLHLIGWARNAATKSPASRILASFNGQPARAVRPWLSRPDIVQAYQDPVAHYGFILELPLHRLTSGKPYTLTVLALDHHGAASPLHWGFKETLTALGPRFITHFSVDQNTGHLTRRFTDPWPRRLIQAMRLSKTTDAVSV